MNQNIIKDYSISVNAQNELSIAYNGQITQDILEFKFLEEEDVNKILNQFSISEQQEFSSIIITINQGKQNQEYYDVFGGINKLLKLNVFKEVTEIQFLFPSNGYLKQKLKTKKIKTAYFSKYFLEIYDELEIKVEYREEKNVQNNWQFLLNSKSFLFLIQNFGRINAYDNNYQSFECVLNDEFEYILLNFNSLKLEIQDRFDTDIQQNYRFFNFLLSVWPDNIAQNLANKLITDLNILSHLLINPIKNHEKLCYISYVLMYDEAPQNRAIVLNQINDQILSLITLFSKLAYSLQIYITPIELLVDISFKVKKVFFFFIQPYLDPIDNLITLFQQISVISLFLMVDVDFSSPQNNYFPIFTFIMETQKVFKNLELGINFCGQELIPRKLAISLEDGLSKISDQIATYQILLVQFEEIYQEIVNFIFYLKQFSPNITQVTIMCSLNSFDEFKYDSYVELLQIVIGFQTLLDFKIINASSSKPNFYFGNIYEETFEKQAEKYFIKKRKIIFTYLKIQEILGKRIKPEIIKQLIEFLPNEDCLNRIQI